MKIRKIVASDFGCLSGAYTFADDRANVVVEENERGKSTLVAAILAGLYGFPPSRERDRLTEKETYQPWKGGSYSVQMEVEDDRGRNLLIRRDLGKGTGRVTDLSTNKDITEKFRVGKSDIPVGERLLDISREVFLKTCLVKQLEIQNVAGTPDLVSKVQQIFDTSGGKVTSAKAVAALEGALREYPGTQTEQRHIKVETEIERLNKAIAEKQARVAALLQERQKSAPAMIRLQELRTNLETLQARRQELEYLSRRAEIAETESSLKEDAKNRDDLKNLIERKESLKEYSDFTSEQASTFALGVGQLQELGKKRKELTASLATIKTQQEATKSKLKDFDGFETLSEDFKTQVHDLHTELARLAADLDKKRKELSNFEESLRLQGYDPSEIDELRRKFIELSVEEKDLLRDSEARIPGIDADVARLEAEERRYSDELRAMKRLAWLYLPAGLLLFLAGFLAAVLGALEAYVLLRAACGVVLAVYLYLLFRHLRPLKARKIKEVAARERDATGQRESLLSEREALLETLGDMATRTGFQTVEELGEAFKRWGRLADRSDRLNSLRNDATSGEESLTAWKQDASVALQKMGLRIPPQEIDLGVMRDAENRMAEYLNLLSSLKLTEEHCKGAEDEIGKLDEEGKKLRDSLSVILAAANLPRDVAPDDARPGVEEAREKGEEFRRLTTREIPERERRLLSSEKLSAMKQRLESLNLEIQQKVSAKPELQKLQPTEAHSVYENEARAVAKKIGDNTDERARISRDVQNVEDGYRREYPRLANEIADLKQTLDRTERFQKSISIAIETLQKISAQSHAQWATVLNQRAGEILRHLNPRCRELKFDENLNFTVVPAEGAQPLEKKHLEAQESVGARHQIYLAVRLALADYLSSAGTKLPVILDDPFATSDDERFLSGMRFLCGEFRKNHQVIILTCHRQRHSELIRQKAPDLVEEMRIIGISTSA